MARIIRIFDTTLRDGEQAPGCSMNLGEKLEVAKQLQLLGVDILEAGFAIASPGDFAAVKEIARVIRGPVITSLARALPKDIDCAWQAIKSAEQPRIHTFIATSAIHLEHKLKMSETQVLEQIRAMVGYARKLCPDVEFSAEDASRSDPDFLCRAFETAIAAGARTINIPDTVGYALPHEFGALVRQVMQRVPNIDQAVVSVHCHNDLGLAVANTLAAVREGAGQVECTINGLGERAGNAALEEIIMSLRTRSEQFEADCNVDTRQLHATSRLVSTVTGVKVQPNKAIVGANAFAHEAGIHQHGILANRQTYEIMTPESIGLASSEMVLGKHSGRHAFEERLALLGLRVPETEVSALFDSFKELADKKKLVSDRDIEALAMGRSLAVPEFHKLDSFVSNSGTKLDSSCTISLHSQDTGKRSEAALGDGPIDAAFKAIDRLTGREPILQSLELNAVTGGTDAQGEARVRISFNNQVYNGHGISTDIVEAGIRAYLMAINALEHEEGVADAASISA